MRDRQQHNHIRQKDLKVTTQIAPQFRTALPIAQLPSMVMSFQNVSKQYNKKNWGLRDFSLEIGPGVFGLLGPNGAGKSALMRMLATITKPIAGTILWNDTDIVRSPDTLRAVLGYLSQDFGIYPNPNNLENLEGIRA